MNPVDIDLPEPRADGKCARCGKDDAATRDGRFCKKCLKDVVARLTPGSTKHAGVGRNREHMQAYGDDGGPWGENNVRLLEDG
jgi:ribosomal protein S14